jgi:hypothetical protein
MILVQLPKEMHGSKTLLMHAQPPCFSRYCGTTKKCKRNPRPRNCQVSA